MADENCTPSNEGMKALVCVGCEASFLSNRERKFCGKSCSKRYFKRKYRKQARQANALKCVTCSKEIFTNQGSGRNRKYCSDQCKPYFKPPITVEQRVVNCKNCGREFERAKRNVQFCQSSCRKEFWKKNDKLKAKADRRAKKQKLAESGGYKLNCQWCNEVFSCLRLRKYCTPVCSGRANTEKQKIEAHQSGKKKPIEQIKKEARDRALAEGRIFNCRNCGKENWRKKGESSTNKKAGSKPTFCNVSCMSEWRKKQNPKNGPEYAEREEKLKQIKELKKVLSSPFKRLGSVLRKRRAILIYLAQRVKNKHRSCSDCDVKYCDWPLLKRGNASFRCPTCQDEANRLNKKAWKAKRKAAEKGANGYAFDVFEVFERDGWRCRLCDCSSPKILRGTYHPSAPELDHIKPLSKGGEHTMENTQLLCRTCNAMKRDKSMTWAKRQLRSRDLRSLKLF